MSQVCHRVGPTGNKYNNIENLMYTITILKNVITSRTFLCRYTAVYQIKVPCAVLIADLTCVLLQDFVFLLSTVGALNSCILLSP